MGIVEYAENDKNANALWLLQKIKIISAGVDTTANVVITYHQQFMSLLYFKQESTDSIEEYLKRFNDLVATTKLAGGENMWYCEKLFNKKIQDANEDQIKESEEKVQAIFFYYTEIKLDSDQGLEC